MPVADYLHGKERKALLLAGSRPADERRKEVLSERWAKVREAQLTRAPNCRVCTALGFTTRATEVDHITPRSMGGALFDPRNLQSLCKTHHSSKTQRLDRNAATRRAHQHDHGVLDQDGFALRVGS